MTVGGRIGPVLGHGAAAARISPTTAAVGRKGDAMIGYTTQASWVLVTAFTVSALYELFRSTAKAGTSRTTPRGGC